MFIPPPHFYRQNIFLHLVACVLHTRGETANTIRETGDFEKYPITAVWAIASEDFRAPRRTGSIEPLARDGKYTEGVGCVAGVFLYGLDSH